MTSKVDAVREQSKHLRKHAEGAFNKELLGPESRKPHRDADKAEDITEEEEALSAPPSFPGPKQR